MVYVFGVEGVPIFEMIFIVAILLLIGFVIILLEIRKLKGLITKEKTDISRFESDLTRLEGDTQPGSLQAYIEQYVKAGYKKEQIVSAMVQAGYKKADVERFL